MFAYLLFLKVPLSGPTSVPLVAASTSTVSPIQTAGKLLIVCFTSLGTIIYILFLVRHHCNTIPPVNHCNSYIQFSYNIWKYKKPNVKCMYV